MMRMKRELRLIPIVLLATICLLALKVSGIVFDGGYTLADRLQGRHLTDLKITTADSVPEYPKIVAEDRAAADVSWAQAMFNYRGPGDGEPKTSDAAKSDVTGSVGGGSDKAAKPRSDDITHSSGGGGEKNRGSSRHAAAEDQHQAAGADQARRRRRAAAAGAAGQDQFAGRARYSRPPAGPAAGTGNPQSRTRHARKPDQGRRETPGSQSQRVEGNRGPHQGGERGATRPRRSASKASSPCMKA